MKKTTSMGEVRYVKKVYPLYISLDFDRIPDAIQRAIRNSKDFVAVRIDCEEVMNSFCLYYATLEARNEMAKWFTNVGFEQQTLVPFYNKEQQWVELKREYPVYADYRDDPKYVAWLTNKSKTYNDIINLNTKDYEKVLDVIYPEIEQKRLLISDLIDSNLLPFLRITIQFNSEDGVVKFNCIYQIESNSLYIECDIKGDKMFKAKFNIAGADDINQEINYQTELIFKSLNFPDNGFLIPITKTFNDYGKEEDEFNIAMWHFFFVNYFVRIIPSCYTKTTKKEQETYVEGKGNNKRYKNRIVLKSVYEVSLKNYSVRHIRHIFKCLCWGVRGHYRHYKNGKVVFIKSFRKGKERNNLAVFQEKEYKI